MPGRGKSRSWWKKYHNIRKSGMSKTSAAKIANSIRKRRRKKR